MARVPPILGQPIAQPVAETSPIAAASAAKPTKPSKPTVSKTVQADELGDGSAQGARDLRTKFLEGFLKPVAGIAAADSLPQGVTLTANSSGEPPIEITTRTPSPFSKTGETKYSIRFSDNVERGFSRPDIPNYGGDNAIVLPNPELWDKNPAKVKNTLRAAFIGDPFLYPRHRQRWLAAEGEEKVVLTDDQTLAVKKGSQALQQGKDGVIEMPTGTGKTIVAMEIMDRYLKTLDEDPNNAVIFLVRTKKILDDLERKTIPRFYPRLKPLVRRVSEEKSRRQDFTQGRIFLTTPGALKNQIDKIQEAGKKIVHVIVDEVQDAKADGCDELIKDLKARSKEQGWNTRFLGYSATPFRQDDRDVLAEFGNNIIHQYTKRAAWHEGYLPTMKIQRPKITEPSSLTDRDRKVITVGRIDIPFWKIRDTHKQCPSYNGKTLIIVQNTAQATELNQYLNSQGIKSVEIHTANKDEETDIDRWERPNGETNSAEVAIAVNKFNVGVDIRPGHVIICRNIESNPLLVQTLGRGLRPDIQKSHLLVSDLSEFSDNGSFLRLMLSYFREKIQEIQSTKDLDGDDDDAKENLIIANHLDELRTHFSRHHSTDDLELECYHLDSSVAARVRQAVRDLPSFLATVHKKFNLINHTKEIQALDKHLAGRLGIDTSSNNWANQYDERIKELAKIITAKDNATELYDLRVDLVPLFTKYNGTREGDRTYDTLDTIGFGNTANRMVLDSLKCRLRDTREIKDDVLRRKIPCIFEELGNRDNNDRIRAESNLKLVLNNNKLFKGLDARAILNKLLEIEYPPIDEKIDAIINSLKTTPSSSLNNLLSPKRDTRVVCLGAEELAVFVYMVLYYAKNQDKSCADKIELRQYAPITSQQTHDQLYRADFYSSMTSFTSKANKLGLIEDISPALLVAKFKQCINGKTKTEPEKIRKLLEFFTHSPELLEQVHLESLHAGLPDIRKISAANTDCFATHINELEKIIRDAVVVDTMSIGSKNFELRQMDPRRGREKRDIKRFCIASKADDLFNEEQAFQFQARRGKNVNYFVLEANSQPSKLEQEYSRLKDDDAREEYLEHIAAFINSAIDSIESDKATLILCPKDKESSDFYRRLQNKLAEKQNVFGPVTERFHITAQVSTMPNISVHDDPLSYKEASGESLDHIAESIADYKRQKLTASLADRLITDLDPGMMESNRYVYVTQMITEALDDRDNIRTGEPGVDTIRYRKQDRLNQVLQAMLNKTPLVAADLSALAILLGNISSDSQYLRDTSDIIPITHAYINHRTEQSVLSADLAARVESHINEFTEISLSEIQQSKLSSGLNFKFNTFTNNKEFGVSRRKGLHKKKPIHEEAQAPAAHDHNNRHETFLKEGRTLIKELSQAFTITAHSSPIPAQTTFDLSKIAFHYNPTMGTYMWLSNAACQGPRTKNAISQPGNNVITAHLSPGCNIYKNFQPKTMKDNKYLGRREFSNQDICSSLKGIELCPDCCPFPAGTTISSAFQQLNTYATSNPSTPNLHSEEPKDSKYLV